MWKIVEGLVSNLSHHITFSDRRDRTFVAYQYGAGRFGTLEYNSMRWRFIRKLTDCQNLFVWPSSCSVVFKSQFDSYLRNIVDLLCRSRLVIIVWIGGICLHGGHYTYKLATN